MEVRVGWNTEMGRTKFDVTVDELDLRRILQEGGIADDPADLTTAEVFRLLEGEARRYSVFASVEYAVMPKEQAVPQLQAAQELRVKRIEAIKKRLANGSG